MVTQLLTLFLYTNILVNSYAYNTMEERMITNHHPKLRPIPAKMLSDIKEKKVLHSMLKSVNRFHRSLSEEEFPLRGDGFQTVNHRQSFSKEHHQSSASISASSASSGSSSSSEEKDLVNFDSDDLAPGGRSWASLEDIGVRDRSEVKKRKSTRKIVYNDSLEKKVINNLSSKMLQLTQWPPSPLISKQTTVTTTNFHTLKRGIFFADLLGGDTYKNDSDEEDSFKVSSSKLTNLNASSETERNSQNVSTTLVPVILDIGGSLVKREGHVRLDSEDDIEVVHTGRRYSLNNVTSKKIIDQENLGDAVNRVKKNSGNSIQNHFISNDTNSIALETNKTAFTGINRNLVDMETLNTTATETASLAIKKVERAAGKKVKRTSVQEHKNQIKEVERTSAKEIRNAPNKQIERMAFKKVEKTASKEIERTEAKEIHRSAGMELQRSAMKQIERNVDTERLLDNYTTSETLFQDITSVTNTKSEKHMRKKRSIEISSSESNIAEQFSAFNLTIEEIVKQLSFGKVEHKGPRNISFDGFFAKLETERLTNSSLIQREFISRYRHTRNSTFETIKAFANGFKKALKSRFSNVPKSWRTFLKLRKVAENFPDPTPVPFI